MAMDSFLATTLTVENFVLSEDQLPLSSSSDQDGGFPEIDLAQPDEELVPLMCAAASTWGFFRITNHGVSQPLLDKILSQHSPRFFQQPLQQKLRILKKSVLPMGYAGSSQNVNIKSWSENLMVMPGKERIGDLLGRAWPSIEECEGVSADFDDCCTLMGALAERILGILFAGLDVDPHDVTSLFDLGSSSSLRVNYYPPCPVASLTYGSPPHKDFGGLSILYQDNVGGLEIFKDGQWIRVHPQNQCLIVNVGDIIQVLSNQRYKSVLHRSQVNECEPRLSLVFFYNPKTGTTIAPIPNLVTNENPPKYKPFSWEEYRSLLQKAKLGNHSTTLFFEVDSFPNHTSM